ncbi:hypothetical protein ACJMK2_024393 [Sinanodonta woodiana]|uniref:Uncharacterized protein n=1 Tax=Sinanodonta woodiana TaxID=1069815 RepID=A0ABD3T776_SINWO
MGKMKICFLVLLLTCAQPANAWLYTIVGGIAAAIVAPYAIPVGVALGFTSLGAMTGIGIGTVSTPVAAGIGAMTGAIYETSKNSKDQK